ncbi:MAG: IclR family transcriptional regulator [Thermosphaera sp.]
MAESMTAKSQMPRDREPLSAYDKLLLALTAFEARPRWQLGELSQELGLPKATAHRILKKLREYDFVNQDSSTDEYLLGYRLWSLARKAMGKDHFSAIAHKYLIKLAEESGETAFLTVPEGLYSLCVDKVEGAYAVRLTLEVGLRAPLHLGASNRILLAFLPASDQALILNHWLEDDDARKLVAADLLAIRRQGYSYTVAQQTPGAAALAVPILDEGGNLVAGLSIGGPASRLTWEVAQPLLPLLVRFAGVVAEELGLAEAGAAS